MINFVDSEIPTATRINAYCVSSAFLLFFFHSSLLALLSIPAKLTQMRG